MIDPCHFLSYGWAITPAGDCTSLQQYAVAAQFKTPAAPAANPAQDDAEASFYRST